MVILSVDVHRFGKLFDFKADFDPSFNLIDGANETGKSTLASFILYMLYGFDDGSNASVPERRLRAPWDGEEVSGSMTVEEGGVRYLIERSALLDEGGKRDSYRLTNLDTGISEEGGIAPGERFLGVPREVFASTAFFAADTMLHADGELLTRAIENIVFSADERHSVARAMYALASAREQTVSSDGKGGIILSLEKKREELEERLAEIRARERLLIDRENALFSTKEKRRECERMLAESHRLETDYFNAVVIRDYDRLHELEDSAAERDRAIEEFEARHRRGEFLPDASYLTELATAKADMDHAESYVKETAEALAETEKKGSTVTEAEEELIGRLRREGSEEELKLKCGAKRSAAKKHTVLLSVFYPLAVLLLAVGIWGFIAFGSPVLLVMLAVSLASVGMAAVSTVELIRARRALGAYYSLAGVTKHEELYEALALAADAERRAQTFERRLEEEKRAALSAREARDATAKKLGEVLCRWRNDLRADENYGETVKTLSREVGEYIAGVAALGHSKEDADAEVRALRARLRGTDEIAVRALVPPAEREKLCNENNATDLRHAVEHYEKLLASFAERELALSEELAGFDRRESSAEVEEEMLALDERIKRLREYAALCGLAEEKLRGGFDRLRTEISPRLSLYACGLLDSLTDGKYTELAIADDFSLYIVSENGEKEVAYLSHGTKELTYFSLRVALLDLLYRTGVPVCLDETFAHQDDNRARSFMQSLRMLASEGKQCFLFSCHAREKELADGAFTSYRRITLR